jgi:uncharacterized protein
MRPELLQHRVAGQRAGLASLVLGASRIFAGENVLRTVVEMEFGVLLVTTVSSGASLAGPDCALEVVAHEMSLLAEPAGWMLTPAFRAATPAFRAANAASPAASPAGRP